MNGGSIYLLFTAIFTADIALGPSKRALGFSGFLQK